MTIKTDFAELQRLYQQKTKENRKNPAEQENTVYGTKLRMLLKKYPITIDNTKTLKPCKG